MAYWDSMVNLGNNNIDQGGNSSGAYANTWPLWEQQTPQYNFPTTYSVVQETYRKNSIVYAAINKLASTVAEPPCKIYKDSQEDDKAPEEINGHPFRKLLRRVNPWVSERQFWIISLISMITSGRAIWEKEYSNGGDVINMWAMRPDWCSFMRGDGKPLRAVRYQPYGLPPKDIPIEKLVVFDYFDPLFPFLKGLSPMLPILSTVMSDNAATDMLKVFFDRGTVISGVLKSDQKITPVIADQMRERWRNQTSLSANWWDVVVLGEGMEYQNTAQTFKDMDFANIDGRTEARICSALRVPPILLGAKVGLNASTYSNYESARESFYEDPIQPYWSYLADELQAQLLPDFENDGDNDELNFIVQFDTSKVKALQPDVDAQWTRAVTASTANVITRDEAREVMGLDPVDDGPVFVGQSATARGVDISKAPEPMALLPDTSGSGIPPKRDPANEDNQLQEDAKQNERKQFRAFADKRIKEGKDDLIKSFKFNHLDNDEQDELLSRYQGNPLVAELKRANDLLENDKGIAQHAMKATIDMPTINITIPEIRVPDVTVNIPEQPAPIVNITTPAPIVNVAAPQVNVAAPVVNMLEQKPPVVNVHLPEEQEKEPRHLVITRDRSGNITGMKEEN